MSVSTRTTEPRARALRGCPGVHARAGDLVCRGHVPARIRGGADRARPRAGARRAADAKRRATGAQLAAARGGGRLGGCGIRRRRRRRGERGGATAPRFRRLSGRHPGSSQEEELRRLGLYVVGLSQGGWRVTMQERSAAPSTAATEKGQAARPGSPLPKVRRAPRAGAKRPAAPKRSPQPPPEKVPYADFDPTVPIPKEDEPPVATDEIERIRAAIVPALKEANWLLARAENESIGAAVMRPVQRSSLKRVDSCRAGRSCL